jgi:glycosyltransferase involved in cell wall biosynthesis
MCPINYATLSIVTVVKDDLPGLSRTAQAILSQTQMPFEWIIIDGTIGSECERFISNLRIDFNHLYVKQDPNGIYSAMNLGLEMSTGEFVWFINAGDYPLGQSVLGLVNGALNEPGSPDLLAFTVIHLIENKKFYSATIPKTETHEGYSKAAINHQGFVAARKIFTLVGNFDESLQIAADSKFMDLAISRSKIKCLNFALIGFELGGASSQNYSVAIRELATFRPKYFHENKPRLLLIKNRIRLAIIKFYSNQNTRFLVKWYLARKHNEVLKALACNSILLVKN